MRGSKGFPRKKLSTGELLKVARVIMVSQGGFVEIEQVASFFEPKSQFHVLIPVPDFFLKGVAVEGR